MHQLESLNMCLKDLENHTHNQEDIYRFLPGIKKQYDDYVKYVFDYATAPDWTKQAKVNIGMRIKAQKKRIANYKPPKKLLAEIKKFRQQFPKG